MSRKNPTEFSPGQRVSFRVFPETGKAINRGGVVTGPDTENPGQMLVQGDPTPDDKKAERAGEIFSVWFAKGAGLVTGPNAPTTKTVSKGPEPMALVHRGPHSQAVVDLVAKVFGAQAKDVMEFPMLDEDGTTVYAFKATAEDLPALQALIDGEPSAKQHLAIVEDPENDQLDELNAERDWPTLTAPK